MFEGFASPTRNYFAMPNEWTDITAEIDSLAELKVVEYVLRHTWGFHEFGICKAISLDEFMHGRRRGDDSRMDKGTKLSRPSVVDGLRRAVDHGYLTCEIDTTDQARVKKSYALKMLNTGKDSLPPDQSRIFTPPVKILYWQSRSASQDSLPRSEKETLEKHLKKEREAASVTQETNSLSLSQKSSSLLDQLTDEQSDFWARWCTIAGAQDLNETAHKHVVALASKITTTEALQSLYAAAYDRVRDWVQTTGKEALPPRLGNLVKCLAEWEQAQARKQQEKEQAQATHEHVSGSGSLTNWTAARLAGNQPVINYDPRPPVKPASGLSQVGNISAGLQERIRQARERRATQS